MLHGRAASLAAVKGLRLGKLSRKAARGEGASVSCSANDVEPLTHPVLTAVFTAACTCTHGTYFPVVSFFKLVTSLVYRSQSSTGTLSVATPKTKMKISGHSYILDDLANDFEACM
jgi:hypothetical protein